MSDNNRGGLIILIMLAASLGYFVYGGIDGVFAITILCVLYGLMVLLSLIPFIGIGLQYWASIQLVLPWVISNTGIYPTWLTTYILIYNMLLGFIFWIIVTVKVVGKIKEYIDEKRCIRKIEARIKEELLKSETPAEAGNNH